MKWIKSIIDKFLSKCSGIFQDNGTGWSSTRVAFIIEVFISNLAIFGVWVGLSLASKQILPIDQSIIILYSISNGLSIGSKVWSKKQELSVVDSTKESKPDAE